MWWQFYYSIPAVGNNILWHFYSLLLNSNHPSPFPSPPPPHTETCSSIRHTAFLKKYQNKHIHPHMPSHYLMGSGGGGGAVFYIVIPVPIPSQPFEFFGIQGRGLCLKHSCTHSTKFSCCLVPFFFLNQTSNYLPLYTTGDLSILDLH